MKRLIGSLVLIASTTLTVNPLPAVAGAAGPIRLRVMSFNIQYGGKLSPTGLHAVVDAIHAADADVVGLQEPFGNTRRIAHMLGWHSAPRLHLVSRYPIVFPAGSRSPGNAGGHIPEGLWGYLLLGGGSVAAVANTHTPSSPDGVKLMMQGADRSQVLAVERRVRVSWVQPHLDATSGPIADGIPTFFTGDFNSPSHLDWTRAAVDALGWQPSTIDPPGRRYAVRWPVTVATEQAGYRDSFREAHPDPIATPAFTYCVTRYPACAKWDSWDRIDYVFAAGPSTTVHSRIVGEGGPYTDIVSRPWPTDHRSVVSVFDVQRVTPPDFAAPTVERVFVGRTVHVAFHAAAAPDRSIGLWARGDDPSAGPAAALAAVGDSEADGSVSVDTAGLTSGPYTVAMLDDAGNVLARSKLAVVDPDAPPTVTTSAGRYAQGDPIRVSWTGATGNRYDWLELNRDCFDPTACPLRQWRYIDGRVFGSASFTRGSTGVWPLRPGRYVVSLCIDDDYRCVATSRRFRISAG